MIMLCSSRVSNAHLERLPHADPFRYICGRVLAHPFLLGAKTLQAVLTQARRGIGPSDDPPDKRGYKWCPIGAEGGWRGVNWLLYFFVGVS